MNVVGEVINIVILFFEMCEIPIIGFGSISLWELLWGFLVVALFFEIVNAFMGG